MITVVITICPSFTGKTETETTSAWVSLTYISCGGYLWTLKAAILCRCLTVLIGSLGPSKWLAPDKHGKDTVQGCTLWGHVLDNFPWITLTMSVQDKILAESVVWLKLNTFLESLDALNTGRQLREGFRWRQVKQGCGSLCRDRRGKLAGELGLRVGQGALNLKMLVLAEPPGACENGLLVPTPRVYDSLGLWSGLEICHLPVSEQRCCSWVGI